MMGPQATKKIRHYAGAMVLVLLASVCRAEGSAYTWSDSIRKNFVQELRKSSDSVQLTEYFSRRLDEPSYLTEYLIDNLFSRSVEVVHRELRATPGDEDSALHLGLLSIRYDTESNAEAIEGALGMLDPKRTFKSGKVLIRFAAARRGEQILIAYSENFLDPRIEQLFRSIERERAL